jgi:hypothetical protein
VAKVEIKAGATVDIPSRAEIAETMRAQLDQGRQQYRAVSIIRLPVQSGTPSGSAVAIGGDSATTGLQTPDQGYVWSVRHISIEGLTAGATPDVINVIRAGRTFWKISGAPPSAATWGRGEFMLNAGETLSYTNFGTLAATGLIVVSGTAWQVPAQLAAELGL